MRLTGVWVARGATSAERAAATNHLELAMDIEQFLREYRRINSERTRKSYRGFLAQLDLFLRDHNLTIDTVHPADIQQFAEWVKGRFNPKTGAAGLSDVAVQSHLAAVSSHYRWRRCRDTTLRNPVAAFKYSRREPKNTRSLIDPDSVAVMGEQSDCELGNLVVRIRHGSGMCLSELVLLNKRNVTIDMGSKGAGKKPCGSVKV